METLFFFLRGQDESGSALYDSACKQEETSHRHFSPTIRRRALARGRMCHPPMSDSGSTLPTNRRMRDRYMP
ncbi:MAG: hypothetical protein ACFFFG_18505, partial [Candidatus Thorarchaeota archaeon]